MAFGVRGRGRKGGSGRRAPLLVLVLASAFAGGVTLNGSVAEGAPVPTSAAVAAATSVKPGANVAPSPTSAPTPGGPRWTADTPDAMIDAALGRALAPRATDAEVAAALLTIGALDDSAAFGKAKAAFGAIAAAPRVNGALRSEAALFALGASMPRPADEQPAVAKSLGLATGLVVIGPFRDTGGGLARKEGPEAEGAGFARRDVSYAWGTVEVAPRAVPPALAGNVGVPLDLFLHPRRESCSYVASRVDVAAATPFQVRIAATGQVRATFDGEPIGESEDSHEDAFLDRLAARVKAPVGRHLVVVKTCSGALGDDGRVRIRFTDESGAALPLATSSELVDPSRSALKGLEVKAVPTALARALAAKEQDETTLAATALVRVLGGADDQRSPRAPGQLEALTRKANLAADTLALAGWIAPFGAQRSGWLDQAFVRATAKGDGATRGFVERRLVESRLHAGLSDWAMATLRGSSAQEAKDAEAERLRAQVLAALGTEALRHQSAEALLAARVRFGDAAPTGLLSDLATAISTFSVERGLAAREVLARRGYRDGAYAHALTAKGAPAVAAAVRAAFEQGQVGSCDEGFSMASALVRTGDGATARDIFGRLTILCPNRPEAWTGLAHALAATGTERSPALLAALRRARELEPGEGRVRAELALRAGKEDPKEGRDDERYLVPSSTVLSRRKGVPKGVPDVADRQIYWLRAVVMHDDKRVSQLMHYAREIVVAPRTQDELYEPMPIEGDTVEILRARVHKKDGGTAFPAEEHNEGSRAYVRWPDLSPGDVVEVAIRNWTSRPVGGRGDAPFSFFDYAGATTTHPLLYNEVIVERAPGASLFVDVLGGAPDKREEKDERGRHVTRLVWNNPPNVPDEPLSPKLTEVVPMIVGSTYRTWDDFRAWYKDAVRGFTEPDAEVRRLAADLTKGKISQRDKIEALFNFVADDIRYVNYVSGEWWLPNRPQQVLARREGDCDDKALLLITLLKAVGIDAQEVMVQTRMTGQPSLLRAKNIAVPLFDHGIAYMNGPGGGLWLDATSPQSRLGPLPSMDTGGMALRLEDKGGAVEIPGAMPDDHGSDVRWTLTLAPDGSADLAGEETHSGDSAFWLRSSLTEEGARAPYVESALLGGWLPTVEVDKDIAFKGDLPRGAAWVKYHAKSVGFARREENELVVSIAPSRSLTSSLAPLAKRALPVVLPSHLAPSHSTRTVRLVAPPGHHWAEPPAPGEVASPFGKASFGVTREGKDGKVLVASRSISFTTFEVPVLRYDAFRAWLEGVDALMNRRLRLVPDGKETP